jgi:hypothetical protein
MKQKRRSFTVYFGGELLSLPHLIGNAWLAETIYEKSHGRFRSVLPQDSTALRGASSRATRDASLRTLVACDLALFHLDGLAPDSAAVAEFMFAKFADIPAVLLRTDLRHFADRRTDPWMLAASCFPRTATVVVAGLPDYRAALLRRQRRRLEPTLHLAGQHSSAAAQLLCEHIAAQCVRALDRVRTLEPVLPKYLREEIYQWLALAPALRGTAKELRKEFERALERKVERDLL